MKKRRNLPLRSLGSEEDTPSVEDLVSWIRVRQGAGGDLLTYQLERSLSLQQEIEVPCIGGCFYGRRVREATAGIEGDCLTGEPGVISTAVIDDARRIATIRRRVWFALPPPSGLGIKDQYYSENEEFVASLCDVERRLMREMRDAGAAGHVILADRFEEVERDELPSRRIILVSPAGTSEALAELLEVQDRIAVPAARLDELIGLLDEYDVRELILLDGGPGEFAAAAEHFDTVDLIAGGYCTGNCREYWKERKHTAYLEI